MYNSETPLHAELPSSKQLMRSTIVAAISAAVLLVTVVLPAEYGIDPTGVGRVLRLAEMGEIKVRLAREAAADSATGARVNTVPEPVATQQAEQATAQPSQGSAASSLGAPRSEAAVWRDEMSFTLATGEGIEIKMRMQQGDKAVYVWAVENGVVNFDTHGDGGGRSISYEKGRSVAADEGELVAAFTGSHGWFWRNRGSSEVKVVLRTRGEYSEIKRVK